MRYYVYCPGITQESVVIYNNKSSAQMLVDAIKALGYEAFVCEFGYPFA